MVAVEGPGSSKEAPELFRAVGSPLGVAETGRGVDRRFWSWDLADRVGIDAAVVLGRLEDAVEHRPAGHHGVVADCAAQLVLPAADHADGDRAELVMAEERQQVAAEAALGRLEGGGAAVGISRPDFPPLAGPGIERLLAKPRVDPAPAGQPGEQVVLE